MFDSFVAAMKCTHCGTVSPADGSTSMQTKIRDDAYNIDIPVGFEFDPDEVLDQNLIDSGYEPTGNPRPDGKLRLVEYWICPTCRLANLAQVTIDGTTVAEIVPIPIERASTKQAQFLDSSSTDLLANEP